MDGQSVCKLLGKNIRRFRLENQWSQEDLAEKIGVSASFLSNVETGRAWVSPKTIACLVDTFAIEPGELLTPLPTMTPETKAYLENYTQEIQKSISQTIKLTKKRFLSEQC
jgi:transcriptional regulator with XRE-family HTH domain